MRCKACNKLLNDFEGTRRYSNGEFMDLCQKCYKASDYSGFVSERKDLLPKSKEMSDDDDC